ncbi:MAG TPA: hypothetical protein VK478_03490 [Gemmatimonadaceae bacterium]|nr:hypothetical protein [Gemmatimonadaceae bacterium]
MRFFVLGTLALALIPGSGSAQSTRNISTSAFAAPVSPAPAAQEKKGPTIESAAVGVRAAPKLDAAAPRRRTSSGIGHAGALMVVGGGAMVAGSFMDGDPGTFFIVGGAVVLLYGLYQLVQ